VRELDGAARKDPKLPRLGEVRAKAAKLAFQQERYTDADELYLKTLAEDPSLGAKIMPDLSVSLLRNMKRNYQDTIAKLTEMEKQYPKEVAIPFMLGVTHIETRNLRDAAGAFDRARKTGGDPLKVIPGTAIYRTMRAIILDKEWDWKLTEAATNL